MIEHRFISNPHFTETSPSNRTATSKSTGRRLLGIILLIGLSLGVAAAGFFGWRWYTSPKAQLQRIIRRVASKIELPTSVPTVATVTDKSKLANQEFFQKAENGDQILIYSDIGKAILYRPSIDKIVEVAPIQLASNQSGLTTNTTQNNQPVNVAPPATTSAEIDTGLVEPNLTATVGLYNGTTIAGLTKEVELKLDQELNLKIAFRGNAVSRTYTKTLVVDTTGLQTSEAQQIAQILDGEISELPPNEATPSADIVVFIGSDFSTTSN